VNSVLTQAPIVVQNKGCDLHPNIILTNAVGHPSLSYTQTAFSKAALTIKALILF